MTEILRETRVLDAVVSLVDSLLDDFDVVDLLTELTEQCAQLLDVAAAGLLLATPRHQLQLMAATSEKIHDLELFQLQADQGPCLDCYASGQPMSVADVQTEAARWPRFAAAAAEAGFASVHAVPMRAASTVLGALGLFGTGVGELNDADRLVAQTLAHIACVAILQDHPAGDCAPPPARRVDQPDRGRSGQGVPLPASRGVGRRCIHAVTPLRANPRQSPDRAVSSRDHPTRGPPDDPGGDEADDGGASIVTCGVRSHGAGHGRGAPPPGLGVARHGEFDFRIADPPQPVESLLGAGGICLDSRI